ncbi:hypothetical protein, partial [Escherichia coli]
AAINWDKLGCARLYVLKRQTGYIAAAAANRSQLAHRNVAISHDGLELLSRRYRRFQRGAPTQHNRTEHSQG